ncbi:MAG: hypothetical protein ABL999_08005 [Pyrinomonadaceae bacterium]
MKITFLTAPLLLLTAFTSSVIAQSKPSPLDQYLDDAAVIVVVKCLSVGAVNILLRANVEIEVMHVVKGGEIPKKITVDSQFEMAVGEYYLLMSKSIPTEKQYLRANTRDSVIPIASAVEAEKLKTFSPRIAVLRTMNIRISELESEIRTRAYELEALKNVKGYN